MQALRQVAASGALLAGRASSSSRGQAVASTRSSAQPSSSRRGGGVAVFAAQEQFAEESVAFRPYNKNAYLRQPVEAFEFEKDILNELSDVTLRLEKRHGGQPWLPGKSKSSCLPLVKYIEEGIDIFSLDYNKLYAEAAPFLTPADEARLRKLTVRYYVEKVLSREQLIERCRRIYESDPRLFWDTDKEAQDLLESFTQMDIDSFALTVLVGKRAEEREAEIALHVARFPGQNLPDPTDLAIADVTLYLEFEREFFLLEKLEGVREMKRKAEEEEDRRRAAFDAVLLLLSGAQNMDLSPREMLEVGATEEHVEAYLADRGELPFTLEEFRTVKQGWLKEKRAREEQAEQERLNRRRAMSESPIDVVAGGPPVVGSLDQWREPVALPKRSGAYESNLAESLGARPVMGGNARPDAGSKKTRGRTPGAGGAGAGGAANKTPRGPAKGRGRPRLSGGRDDAGGADDLWGAPE